MHVIRLAHISDVHVTARGSLWKRHDWLNKRMAAWLNMRVLGRGFRFRKTDTVLRSLADELRRRDFNRVLFSGDATALGFEKELAQTANFLGLDNGDALPGLAVPGNHDYCTREAEKSGAFERHFAPWLEGERIDGHTYPFAQRVGPAWVIGVNSARANRWAWDASGVVGKDQLGRLRTLLEELEPGPRIMVTHYPVTRPGGRLEVPTHRLSDVRELAEVATRGGVGLWLHGHMHRAFHLSGTKLTPFPVICAGSSTQTGLWTYGDYTLTGRHLHAVRRVYVPQDNRFEDAETFDLELPVVG
jgi:3',5'-cyclic AMP phosphodiesterase CpdA